MRAPAQVAVAAGGSEPSASTPAVAKGGPASLEQIRSWKAKLDEYAPQSVLEISPAPNSIWSRYAGYRAVEFPDFDICNDVLPERFEGVKDFGFGRDLSNDPEYPLMVWAFARNAVG